MEQTIKKCKKNHCSSFFFHFAACSIWMWCKRTVRCEFDAYEFHAWCLFFVLFISVHVHFHFISYSHGCAVQASCTRALLEQFQSSRSFTDCMIFVCCYFIDHMRLSVYECCIASHWASIQFTAHNSSFVNFFPSHKVTKATASNGRGAGWERDWNDVTVY